MLLEVIFSAAQASQFTEVHRAKPGVRQAVVDWLKADALATQDGRDEDLLGADA